MSFREQKKSADEQIAWVGGFLRSPGPDGASVVGFKTKMRDILDPDGLAEALREVGARVILQQRRNRIKLTASLFNAVRLNKKTGDWNLYDEGARLAAFAIDVEGFRSWLEDCERELETLVGYVDQLGLPTLSLCYEDLFLKRQETLERVCSFLGVEYCPELEGKCLKNTDDNLREVISNFDELRSHFAGTPYEAMFDEVLFES